MNFNNKTILITGALGQLGKQYCTDFLAEGAHVWASDLCSNKCDEYIKSFPLGTKIYPLELDVADPDSVKAAFQTIEHQSGKLDILINNAADAVFTPFEERSFEDFMRVLKVNAGGTFLCIQAASKLMKKTDTKGCIVNIGSIHGVVSGDPRIYTDCARNTAECYGASKAAIIQMTKFFAVHLAPYKIRVNCVSPGGVYNNHGEDFVKNYSYRTPMGRMADQQEISKSVMFLAAEDSNYINGHNLVVDGGWTIW